MNREIIHGYLFYTHTHTPDGLFTLLKSSQLSDNHLEAKSNLQVIILVGSEDVKYECKKCSSEISLFYVSTDVLFNDSGATHSGC